MIENTILRIPYYAIIASVFVCVYALKKYGITVLASANFWENMFCDRSLLPTWLPIALIILLSGIGIAREDDAARYVRMKSRTQLCAVNLLSIFVAVVLFSLVFLLVAVLIFGVGQGMTFENTWSAGMKNCLYESSAQLYPTPAVISRFSPLGAFGISFLYIIIYCTFLAVFSMTLNTLFKQSVGSIFCALTVVSSALFGSRAMGSYSLYPWYNGDFRALTESNSLLFVGYSVIYWIVIMSVIIVFYCLIMRKCDLIGLSREDKI